MREPDVPITLPATVAQMTLDLRELDEAGVTPFTPYLAKLHQCFRTAFDEWNRMAVCMGHIFPDLSGRTRASFVYDIACKQARTLFKGDKEIGLVDDKSGFLAIVIGGQYVLRLRKLNNNNLACQNHTRQSRLYFSGQAPQMTLPHMGPDLVPMICGYRLNRHQTDLQNVALSFQYKGTRLWFSDVPHIVVDVENAPGATPQPSAGSTKQRKSPRVRIDAKRGVREVDAPEGNEK